MPPASDTLYSRSAAWVGMATSGVVDRLRRPEYTGANRCLPCTATNAAIALAVAVAVGALWTPPAGAVVLAVGLAAIWLRGYLVPYTPTLTKRYFPDRVLRRFEKAPADGAPGEEAPVAGTGAELDPEPYLLDAGAVEVCMDGADLCPTDEFADAWTAEMAALDGDEGLAERIATLVDVDPSAVSLREFDDHLLVTADGRHLARWESRAALVADMAALPLLRERVAGWADLDRRGRGALLNGTRVFLERCPTCDGAVEFSRDTVESCCRSTEVVAMGCVDCGARLLEVEAS